MVKYSRPALAEGRRVRRAIGKFATTLVLAFVVFAASISTVINPSPELDLAMFTQSLPNSLSAESDPTLVTASFGNIFQNAVFVGPNRAEKQDRARIQIDGIAVASSFVVARQKLAELRPQPIPPVLQKPKLPDTQRIEVAALDGDSSTAALSAIEIIATGPAIPMPMSAPTNLAYARANTPSTEFSTPTSMTVAKKQFDCLATAIYFEARGESYRGQAAVAQVVLNRVKHSVYPDTICGVVYQNQSKRNACQFSFACDGVPERITEPGPWKQAQEIAKKVLSGDVYLTEVANSTHYHATYVSPRWAPRLKKMTKIGLHIFYRFKSSRS